MRCKTWITLSALAAAAAPVHAADLLRDDFDGASLNTGNWNIGTWFLGRTQLGFTPQVTSGMARLRHDTYNPGDPGHNSFKGSEIYSVNSFTRGSGLEYEARVRTGAMPSGLVTSFFTYIAQSGSPPLADEIDWEFLTKAINASTPAYDPVLMTTWNNYRTDGSNFGDPNVHSSVNANVTGLDLAQFNTFKIRWLPDRVQWYINNVPIRTALYAVPDLPAPIRANFWAPSTDWGDAYAATLVPAPNAAANVTQLYDVDYIAVRRTFGSVAPTAPNRVFTDTFRNASVSDSDAIPAFWTQRNQGTSSVTETSAAPANLAEPLKLTASGAGFPHAQVASPVRSEFNLFRTPVAIEATGIGFSSTSNSTTVNTIGKSILRFVLSPQTLTTGSQSEYTAADALSLRIEGGNLVALGSKVNAPNQNTEYTNNLVNQVMSGPVRRVYMVLHGTFYLLQVEHDVSSTDSSQVTTEFSGPLTLNLSDWSATGDSAMFLQGQLNNSGAAENMTALVDSLAVSAVRPAWNTTDGAWSNVANWTERPVPNYPGANARFTSAIGGPHTVTTDIAATAGTLTFDSPSAYTLSGGNAITLNTLVDTPRIEAIAGSHTVAAPLVLAKSTTLDVSAGSTLTLSGTVTAAAGAGITKSGAGRARLINARAQFLNIAAGTVEISPNGAAAGVSYLNTLSVAVGASLDLNDNDLVVNQGTFSDIRALVNTGVISSSTSNGSQILALFDNALVHNTSWQGVTIGANAIVGKYTYFGDVNLDGQVTGDDYTVIDSNLNTTPAAGVAWLRGDANTDGNVTGDDYTVIDSNLGLGVGNPLGSNALRPSALTAAPEPGVTLIGVVTAMGIAQRRRRHAK